MQSRELHGAAELGQRGQSSPSQPPGHPEQERAALARPELTDGRAVQDGVAL